MPPLQDLQKKQVIKKAMAKKAPKIAVNTYSKTPATPTPGPRPLPPINTVPGSTITGGDKVMMSIKNKLGSAAKTAAGAVGSGVMNAAKGVTNFVGGNDLADFAGSKIAKALAKPANKKFVADKTSLKDALVSAGKVALTVGPGAYIAKAGGAFSGGAKAAGTAITRALPPLKKIGQDVATPLSKESKAIMEKLISKKRPPTPKPPTSGITY